MTTSSKDTVFDVEQLLFARLREGMSKLGSDIMTKMTRSELHRWLALPLYSSTFRLCPAQRTDSLAPVNLYDEATKVVASTGVNYVVSTCAESHFVSVPVVICTSAEIPNEASKAARYLNISLHQSQLVLSPGFVIVHQQSGVLSVTSFSVDGSELRKMTVDTE